MDLKAVSQIEAQDLGIATFRVFLQNRVLTAVTRNPVYHYKIVSFSDYRQTICVSLIVALKW